MLTGVIKMQRSKLFSLVSYTTYVKHSAGKMPRSNETGDYRISEKDILPKNTDPNLFGTLKENWKLKRIESEMPDEEGDQIEVNYLDGKEGKTRLRTKQYADMIKGLVKEKRIADAIDVLDKRILKEDRAKPENYLYNLLIGACARVGYTKKAFQLYNQMKKRALKVTGGTYTSLFNACANSPIEGDGLKRARHLRELMKEKFYTPNQSNYHAMIKAFGRCGDISTAFSLVDEMLANGVHISSETFNFLLQACASDTEAGFRHAICAWRKMMEKNISPTIFTYNLLLRCVRDSGLGKKEAAIEDIRQITSGNSVNEVDVKELKYEEGDTVDLIENNLLDKYEDSYPRFPNLIASKPHGGSFVYVGNTTKPKHRLMLIGGCTGFLDQMEHDKVLPDIKTMTQLLEIIPSTLESELVLLEAIKKYNVVIDTDFCNLLIRKRTMRRHFGDAKDVMKIIHHNALTPNIVTFGVLSLACRSTEECKQLLSDLDNAGFRPNIEILGSLLRSACSIWDIGMVITIMKMLQSEEINPNKYFMKHLEEFRDRVQNEIKIKENGGIPHKIVEDKYFIQGFKNFCHFYKSWKNKVILDDPDSIHPWKQFQNKVKKDTK